MNKKIIAIVIAALSIGGIGIALAQEPAATTESIVYPKNPTKVLVLEGVAFDKSSKTSKQVIFLVMKYGNEKNVYLIIGEEVYKMTRITEEDYNLGPGTKVIRYKSEDGSVLTILVQKFSRYGQIGISGDFKNYLITFKPYYYRRAFPRPIKPIVKPVKELPKIDELNIGQLKVTPMPLEEWIG